MIGVRASIEHFRPARPEFAPSPGAPVSAPRRLFSLVGLLSAAAFALSTTGSPAAAAHHFDAPTRTDPLVNPAPDTPADIADVYVWHTASDLVIAMTFAGPQPAGRPPIYDRDVLYTINISNANSPTDAEVQLRFRFGRDSSGNVGVEVSGLPDGGPPLVGPVEQTLTRNGILVRAGLDDDPFFFDPQGFRETRSTGNLSFVSSRQAQRGQHRRARHPQGGFQPALGLPERPQAHGFGDRARLALPRPVQAPIRHPGQAPARPAGERRAVPHRIPLSRPTERGASAVRVRRRCGRGALRSPSRSSSAGGAAGRPPRCA